MQIIIYIYCVELNKNSKIVQKQSKIFRLQHVVIVIIYIIVK